jgi:lipopolysaccharide/colanic/teichoic acid biosynthesis glycosyltransferase
MIKRVSDVLLSLTGLVLLSPLMLFLAAWVALGSEGGIIYSQQRVGRQGRIFRLFKFRTMRPGSHYTGGLTIGDRDSRITREGFFLRKFKLDELPQLFNVLKGDMSLVGPRPELPEYVQLYTPEQRRVLEIRPGITDYASLKYIRESELLAESENPREKYVHEIMPEKLEMNLRYMKEKNWLTDMRILLKTLRKLF